MAQISIQRRPIRCSICRDSCVRSAFYSWGRFYSVSFCPVGQKRIKMEIHVERIFAYRKLRIQRIKRVGMRCPNA